MIEYTVKIWDDGTKIWFLNGEYHREDGPAVVLYDGSEEWWLNGEMVTEKEHKKRTSKASCQGKVVEIDGIKYKLEELN